MTKTRLKVQQEEDEVARCRRVRDEFYSQFKSMDELMEHMKDNEKKALRHNALLRQRQLRAKQKQKLKRIGAVSSPRKRAG